MTNPTPVPVIPSRYRPESAQNFLQHEAETPAPWRDFARSQLKARGIPNPKLERWKYTNLLSFEQSNAAPAGKTRFEGDVVRLPWIEQNSRKLLFVNGHLVLGDAKLTLKGADALEGLSTEPMERYGDMMLWALNTAFCEDGAYINIAKNETNQLIEIIHITQSGDNVEFASPRTVINLGDNAEATIIEQWLGNGEGVVHTNHVQDITLGQNASLKHVRLQNERTNRTALLTAHIKTARDARYSCHFLSTGAGLSRQEFWGELQGENGDISIIGAQLISGRQHMDTTILLEHQAPNCTSNQDIKNVLDGRAVGVFQGKVHVHQIAQKTDGYQLCKTIMLSDTAEMNIKPELEIYADDVKCSHGTTTGCIDEEGLFYLRSRGVPDDDARNMLLTAFVAELYEALPEKLAEACLNRVNDWLLNDRKAAA